jgi:peroxiredoxin
MTNRKSLLLLALVLLATPVVRGQATASSINKQLQILTAPPVPAMPGVPVDPSKAGIPDAQRPATITQLAKDISTLPAGAAKVKFADRLAHAATQGEAGRDALQAAVDTLAQALTETPQPAEKDGKPADAYMILARIARYGGLTSSLKDPMLAQASDILVANDADAQKADFTLKDINGKKVTLSSLKGKIVLINFWSSQCPTCTKEMQDLDLIYTHYAPQGLVVLSITGDNPFRANTYLTGKNYHPTVLFDDGGKTAKDFHVDEFHPEGLPRSFAFDRDGKLVGISIDTCTQRQFFVMLGKAGLQPNK